MKKITALLLTIIFACSICFAQEDCNPYYSLQLGKKWTMANYNGKDKYQGKQSFEILRLEESTTGLVAAVKLMSFDKKDKLVLEKEVEFVCESGVVTLDISQYVPAEMMDSFKDMDIKMEVDQIAFPEKLSVGQELPDGGVKMTMNGPMPMTLEVRVVDRRVMIEETMKVPAGSYDTFKINSVTEINMMGKRESRQSEWIAIEVGLVRSESYDKSGQLKYYSILTEYSK
ncbi:MAG: hypothetical protein ACJAT1_002412 [Marivirga sp.]|jgi:hypothetical protein